jgi:hypothetical protein
MKERACSYQQFMLPLQEKLQQLVIDAQSAEFTSLTNQTNNSGPKRRGYKSGAKKLTYRPKRSSILTKQGGTSQVKKIKSS